jgi:hypothetical protein
MFIVAIGESYNTFPVTYSLDLFAGCDLCAYIDPEPAQRRERVAQGDRLGELLGSRASRPSTHGPIVRDRCR